MQYCKKTLDTFFQTQHLLKDLLHCLVLYGLTNPPLKNNWQESLELQEFLRIQDYEQLILILKLN